MTFAISDALRNTSLTIIPDAGKKISELLTHKTHKTQTDTPLSVVYRIPCKDCYKSYIGHTHRGLDTRIAEHKRALQRDDMKNGLTVHRSKEDHQIDWKGATILEIAKTKRSRRTLESMHIASNGKNLNLREGYSKWNRDLATFARDSRHKPRDPPIINKISAHTKPAPKNKTKNPEPDDPHSCNGTIPAPPPDTSRISTYIFNHNEITNVVGYSLRSRSRLMRSKNL